MGQLYVSTLAFKGKTPEEIINIASAQNLAIEFTSSFRYTKGIEKIYLQAPIKRMVHNYFPAPEIPFVLNLASQDETIRRNSIRHCLNCLQISKSSGAPFYAAHAGFCIDPNPSELGKPIKISHKVDKELHKKIFLSSLHVLLEKAADLDIPFLIENNVVITANLTEGNVVPLLCCESQDVEWLFNSIESHHLGLLLDTAHLKVSCKTLGLDIHNEVASLKKYIKAIHHSDNDSLTDNNQPLNQNYWFLKYMQEFRDMIHVIEVHDLGIKEVLDHINLLSEYGS